MEFPLHFNCRIVPYYLDFMLQSLTLSVHTQRVVVSFLSVGGISMVCLSEILQSNQIAELVSTKFLLVRRACVVKIILLV